MPAAGSAVIRITKNGGLTATESADGRFLYHAKHEGSPTSIWRVPVDGGEEKLMVDGLSYALNFAAADRGLYFLALGDHSYQISIHFFEFATGKAKILFNLGKQYWYGMALSPDEKSLLYSVTDHAGGNLMSVENFR